MQYTAAVLTISDKGFRGERRDTSGPALCKMLEEAGWKVVYQSILPDEERLIKEELIRCAEEQDVRLVLTTGGTGFSPRDITPEATLAVIERETPGIAEAMRAESMKITTRGCLSRGVAGIRKRTLIVNLPGSEKAARENIAAVLEPIRHGVEMLVSEGSADCAMPVQRKQKTIPSMDAWIREAKAQEDANQCGMYLFHNGVVRVTAKAEVREGIPSQAVTELLFSYDEKKVEEAKEKALAMPGIYHVRVWLNEGVLKVGDDIMYVLVGGDIRPHVIDALQALVAEIKNHCVQEVER